MIKDIFLPKLISMIEQMANHEVLKSFEGALHDNKAMQSYFDLKSFIVFDSDRFRTGFLSLKKKFMVQPLPVLLKNEKLEKELLRVLKSSILWASDVIVANCELLEEIGMEPEDINKILFNINIDEIIELIENKTGYKPDGILSEAKTERSKLARKKRIITQAGKAYKKHIEDTINSMF